MLALLEFRGGKYNVMPAHVGPPWVLHTACRSGQGSHHDHVQLSSVAMVMVIGADQDGFSSDMAVMGIPSD